MSKAEWRNSVNTRMLRAALALFALSLAVNLAALFLVTGPYHLETDGDEAEYYQLAERLLRGEGFESKDTLPLESTHGLTVNRQVARTPGWPLLLAGLFWLTGPSVLVGKLLNVVVGAGVPVGVFALARAWLPWRWAWLAASASALLPSIVFLNASLYSETVSMLGFVWGNVFVLHVVARARRDGRSPVYRPLDWLAFGFLMGLINMVKPAYVPWLAMLGVMGAWYSRRYPRWFAAVALTSALGFCAVMSPWWVRNVQTTGHFVAFSLAGDHSLLQCNNPVIASTPPTYHELDGRVVWTGAGKFQSDELASGLVRPEDLEGLDEVEQARLFRERALAWITANPGAWAVLALKKLGYGFGVWPLWPGSYLTLVVGLLFTLLALASLPGWWWLLTRPGDHWLLLLQPAAFIATTLLFYGAWRYRAAFEPSFVIAALLGLRASLGDRMLVRRPKREFSI